MRSKVTQGLTWHEHSADNALSLEMVEGTECLLLSAVCLDIRRCPVTRVTRKIGAFADLMERVTFSVDI